MPFVVRVGPVSLGQRRDARLAELNRVFGAEVQLIEVGTVAELVAALARTGAAAVVVDAAPPGELDAVVTAAGVLPVLRPVWAQRRNNRGEVDEVFGGYGVMTNTGISRLADGELSER